MELVSFRREPLETVQWEWKQVQFALHCLSTSSRLRKVASSLDKSKKKKKKKKQNCNGEMSKVTKRPG